MNAMFGTKNGVSIVEVVVSSLIIASLTLAVAYAFNSQKESQLETRRRWKAQIALESVVDQLATMVDQDTSTITPTPTPPKPLSLGLKEIINAGPNADPAPILNSTSHSALNWMSKWEENGIVTNIRVQFKVYNPPVPPAVNPTLKADALAAASNIDNFDIEITAQGDFLRNPKDTVKEQLVWTKTLYHQ